MFAEASGSSCSPQVPIANGRCGQPSRYSRNSREAVQVQFTSGVEIVAEVVNKSQIAFCKNCGRQRKSDGDQERSGRKVEDEDMSAVRLGDDPSKEGEVNL